MSDTLADRPAVTLHLDPQQARVLRETLESAVSDLGMEIADTDRKDYRERLKERRRALIHVLEVLRRQPAASGEGDER